MSKFYDNILAHVAEVGPCTLGELFIYSRRPSIIGFKNGMQQFVKSKYVTYEDGVYEITPKGIEYLQSLDGE